MLGRGSLCLSIPSRAPPRMLGLLTRQRVGARWPRGYATTAKPSR